MDVCRLLTLGQAKGSFDIGWSDLVAHGQGLLVILLPGYDTCRDLSGEPSRLAATFPGRCYLSLTIWRLAHDYLRLGRFEVMPAAARVPTVVAGDVLHHQPERRILQDVVTCIREHCTIDEPGTRREASVDRHLENSVEINHLYRHIPDAIARAGEMAERCRFSVSERRYQYPLETDIDCETPQQALDRQVREHIPLRSPEGVPEDVAKQLRHELGLIAELDYPSYFLTVNSICVAPLNSQPVGFYALNRSCATRLTIRSRSGRSASTPAAGTARWSAAHAADAT